MSGEAYQAFKGQDTQTHPKLTKSDIEGPFYLEGAPDRENIVPDGATGEDLDLSGCVYGLQADGSIAPLAGVQLDIWQANSQGVYDNQDWDNPNQAPPGHVYLFRGKVYSDANGRYRLQTKHPGYYPIGGGEYRTAHIHVKVRLPGQEKEVLTTQLYFPGERLNRADHWYSPVLEIKDREEKLDGSARLIGTFDFVVPAAQ